MHLCGKGKQQRKITDINEKNNKKYKFQIRHFPGLSANSDCDTGSKP
jgi:hypothetical protein